MTEYTLEQELLAEDDFTFYLSGSPAKNFLDQLSQGKDEILDNRDHPVGSVPRHDFEISLKLKHNDLDFAGRALVCRTEGSPENEITLSITFRIIKKPQGFTFHPPSTRLNRIVSSWAPKNDPEGTQTIRDTKFLFQQSEVVKFLHDRIFLPSSLPAHGLLAVFGATGSGKNWVARGLTHNYLNLEQVRSYYQHVKKRPPHLVTYEDPIESFYAEGCYAGNFDGLDYTPRQKNSSADRTVARSLMSALRQTPAAFYVGETRTMKDWKKILDFAATGHFVISTGHAGSLTEAMGTLLKAAQASRPAQRKDLVDRLVAVVHLRSAEFDPPSLKLERNPGVTLPALWVSSNPQSRHAFVANGRSSMIPGSGCVGRHRIAEALGVHAARRISDFPHADFEKFLTMVVGQDIEGL